MVTSMWIELQRGIDLNDIRMRCSRFNGHDAEDRDSRGPKSQTQLTSWMARLGIGEKSRWQFGKLPTGTHSPTWRNYEPRLLRLQNGMIFQVSTANLLT